MKVMWRLMGKCGKIWLCTLFFMLVMLPASRAYASCDYAVKSSPFQVYFDARAIFHGKALKKGVEVFDKKSYQYTVFEVIKPVKGVESKAVTIYHKPDFDGYRIDSEGLVVSIERQDGVFLADYCTLPFYDMEGASGQSLVAVHDTVLSRLGVLLFVSFIFAAFITFLYIRVPPREAMQAAE